VSRRNEIPAPALTPCPLCQGERAIADVTAEMGLMRKGKVALQAIGNFSDLRALVCKSCGYTMFFAKEPHQVT
jgi:predicted nucleic-acid-binding Zn-ribbon protein